MKNKSKRHRQEDFNTDFEEKVLYINRSLKSLKGDVSLAFLLSLSSETAKATSVLALLKPMKFPMPSVKAERLLEKIS